MHIANIFIPNPNIFLKVEMVRYNTYTGIKYNFIKNSKFTFIKNHII